MFRCKCKTLYYPNAKAPDYGEIEGADSFYMRIDQFEGIDSALMPLFFSDELNKHEVIDVGCGLGFTSDFVRFQSRNCLAFDPSTAAKISSLEFGFQISQEFATPQNTKLSGKKLVFCSEVLEHVEDPSNFLKNLWEIAGLSGFLILTTPNAGFVRNRNNKLKIYSLLAPSQHLFIFSESSLSNLAKSAGFKWVTVWHSEERLFLIAGPHPVNIHNVFARSEYVEYLIDRLASNKSTELMRYRCFGYRLFKEYVNSGNYILASKIWPDIVSAYSTLGINLDEPLRVVAKFQEAHIQNSKLPDPKYFPFNVSQLMYLRAILLIAFKHDKNSAVPYFQAAIKLSEIYTKSTSSTLFQLYDLELQSIKEWSNEAMRLHGISVN